MWLYCTMLGQDVGPLIRAGGSRKVAAESQPRGETSRSPICGSTAARSSSSPAPSSRTGYAGWVRDGRLPERGFNGLVERAGLLLVPCGSGRPGLRAPGLDRSFASQPPEFEEIGNSLLIRFLPTRYIPPTRVGHDLSGIQRDILQVLSHKGPATSKVVRESLTAEIALRTVLWNLQVLRELGLVDSTTRGRGFVWALKGVHP